MGTCGMIFSMIAIGGYTRLSGSGLSMTNWKFRGRWLPGSEEQWLEEFEEYKQFPEYQRLHSGAMTLAEFKRIYFVEWFHRMWGRSMGTLFAVPLLYWGAKGVLSARLGLRLAGFLGLGASQAVVGWWMVRSGMDAPEVHTPSLGPNQRPRVSPYRLASHFTAALTLYAGCLWTGLTLLRPSPAAVHSSREAVAVALRLRKVAVVPFLALAGATLLSGPFVAGNDAGRAYNTWPKMLDDWVPPEWKAAVRGLLLAGSGSWGWDRGRPFFEETAVVQFDHRMLAQSTVVAAALVYAYAASLAGLAPSCLTAAGLVGGACAGQMALGIATLLTYVPTELGVAHQAGGILVLTAALNLLHTLRVGPARAALLF